jgi:hypothetical protein
MLRACRRKFCRQPRSTRAIGPAGAAMDFSSTYPAPRIFHRWPDVWRKDKVICGALSHEQLGGTRAYVITKWRQSEIQQVKETKVPPPRTHGKVGDPVGSQCSAVKENPARKVGAAVAAEDAPSATRSMDHARLEYALLGRLRHACSSQRSDPPLTADLVFRKLQDACPISRLYGHVALRATDE